MSGYFRVYIYFICLHFALLSYPPYGAPRGGFYGACLMDVTRFELLEKHVTALLQACLRVQDENTRLSQEVRGLQDTLAAQQQEVERLQNEREELLRLRTTMQVLQQERGIIQQKLQQMLTTIEWLEERTRTEGDAQT